MNDDPYLNKRKQTRKRKLKLKGGRGSYDRHKPTALPGQFVPRFWHEIDGRLSIKKRIRKLYRQLKEESGADTLAKDILCQRAAFLIISMQTAEVNAIESGELDEAVAAKQAANLVNILTKLGLDNQAKPRGTSLKQYVTKGNGYAAGKGRSALGTKDGRSYGNGAKIRIARHGK